jgi:hypothetical protein
LVLLKRNLQEIYAEMIQIDFLWVFLKVARHIRV